MKSKTLFSALVFASLLLFACGKKSEKGKWIEKDKSEFKQGCMSGYDELAKDEFFKMMNIAKDDFVKACDCAVQKAEVNFSPEEILKDNKKVEELGEKCFAEIFMGEKGAYKPKFKDLMRKAFLEEIEKRATNEEEKQVVVQLGECFLKKMEEQIDPMELKNEKENDKKAEKMMKECVDEMHLAATIMEHLFGGASEGGEASGE